MIKVSQTETNLRHRILGVEQEVPLLNGRSVPYVNLDNAASTPPLVDVVQAMNQFLPFYSSVHRGTGFKSRLSSIAYDDAHEIIAKFVGANPDTNAVIFGKNSTEAINKLSYRLNMPQDAIVLTTQLEHHSNDVPWRQRAEVVHVQAMADGRLDEAHFDQLLETYGERIALVTVTGASNVTGFIQPIHRLARKTHAVGAKILVDCAQLAPHRRVDMKPDNHPEHLDFVVLSAHKMYAPFGTGALIGPKETFQHTTPEYTGGGTVKMVMLDKVWWADGTGREEAGSPNVVGAIAMAVAAKTLMEVGMDKIAQHEQELLVYAMNRLQEIPNIIIYGETDINKMHEKVGVIPFNLEGVPHALVAAILGHEGGIGVRSGRFCAQPYVTHLLGLESDKVEHWLNCTLSGDQRDIPGMVRMSFGCYNNTDDVDRLIEMLHRVQQKEYIGEYQVVPATGEYLPVGHEEVIDSFFSLDSLV